MARVVVPHGIVGLTPAMRPAIDFNREPCFGHVEVDDGVRENHLAPNLGAKLPFAEFLPKDALRGRGMAPRVLRARREESAFMTKIGKSPTRHGLRRDTHGSACGRVGLPLVVRFAASRGGEERRRVSQQKAHVDVRAGSEAKGFGCSRSQKQRRLSVRRRAMVWRGIDFGGSAHDGTNGSYAECNWDRAPRLSRGPQVCRGLSVSP